MESDNIQAVIDAGKRTAQIGDRVWNLRLDDDGPSIPIILLDAAQHASVPETAIKLSEEMAATPRRRKGTASLTELESFIAHVNRFKSEHSVIFADTEKCQLGAVLNYHPADSAAWCDHRSVYACPLSPQWRAWCAQSGNLFALEAFSDFVDSHLDDVFEAKDYATRIELIELARHLVIRQKGHFERTIDKATGAQRLVSTVENTAESTALPRAFLLAIPVFEGGALYKVEARLRVRVRGGSPAIGYELHRAPDIQRDAFADVRKKAADETGLPLLAGSPE